MSEPKLPNAVTRRGASMGRTDTPPETPCKMRLYRMSWHDGDYDNGGAYWGRSAKHGDMYRAYGGEDAEGNECELFIRAHNREDAKRQIKAKYPFVTFYR